MREDDQDVFEEREQSSGTKETMITLEVQTSDGGPNEAIRGNT
jgi:hypothetical protein